MTLIENTPRLKRGFISEEDVYVILQRYSATTVLALLQEVALVADENIDWNALVKNTRTGISNAREYQMLWRHLAYRDPLVKRLDDGAEPVDDDSDLEYELEAFPNVSLEASNEAAACVKVLMASGVPSISSAANGTVEAPLMISIPNGQSSRGPSESCGTCITVPVSVPKIPPNAVTYGEVVDANGVPTGNIAPRRKRKPWSTEEDMQLIAAVEKCGEGNWASILKGEFKTERTASQLSQRWHILRKRKDYSSIVRSVGGGDLKLSEAQLAANRALSLALDMPATDNLKASGPTGGTSSITLPGNSVHHVAEPSSIGVCQKDSVTKTVPQRLRTVGPTARKEPVTTVSQRSGKPRLSSVKEEPVTTGTQWPGTGPSSSKKARVTTSKRSKSVIHSPDELVKAAAVAAGARIATPSDAALLKAAQAKNTVRVMPGGGSMMKASPVSNSLPSNVHFIRTGLANSPLSQMQVKGNSVKPIAPTFHGNSSRTTPEQITATSSLANEVKTKKASSKKGQTCFPANAQQEQVQKVDEAPKELVQEKQAAIISGDPLQGPIQKTEASVLVDAPNKPIPGCLAANSKISEIVNTGDQGGDKCRSSNDDFIKSFPGKDGNDGKAIIMDICEDNSMNKKQDRSVATEICETHRRPDDPAIMNICENESVNGKEDGIVSMIVDGSDKKVEVLENEAIGTGTGTGTGTRTGEDEKSAVGLKVTM